MNAIDVWRYGKRTRTRRTIVTAGSGARSIALDCLQLAVELLCYQQGRYEESNAVQEQGLLVDPLNPVLSVNIADRLRRLGEHERAEQLLLRLTYLPEPPGMAYSALVRLYFDTGEFDKSVRWAKEVVLAYHESHPVSPSCWRGVMKTSA